MQNLQYNREQLIQYLLGTLPQAETELFDELSFSDDDFVEQLESVENDLIDDYLHGELTAPERNLFQSNFPTTPRRQEAVRFAQTLQVLAERKVGAKTAEAAATDVQMPRTATEQPPTATFGTKQSESWLASIKSLLSVSRPVMQWGMTAAALVLLIIVGRLMIETERLRARSAQIEQARAALADHEQELRRQVAEQKANHHQLAEELRQVQEERDRLEQDLKKSAPIKSNFALFILSPGVRSGGARDFSILPNTRTVKFRVEFESDDYPRFRAELRTQADDRIVWSVDKLRAGKKGVIKVISLSIPADLFSSQGYLLNLKGITAEEEIEDVRSYSFRIVNK